MFYMLFQSYSSIYFHNMLTCYMHVHLFLILHRHWEFWRLRFAYLDLLMLSCWSGIWRGSHTLQGAGVLLLDRPFSIFFCFSLVLLFPYSAHWTHACSISLFICYHVWTSICTIAVILIHHSDYISCSDYFKLSVYTWVFSLRIYVTDSHSDYVFSYLEKRGMT